MAAYRRVDDLSSLQLIVTNTDWLFGLLYLLWTFHAYWVVNAATLVNIYKVYTVCKKNNTLDFLL